MTPEPIETPQPPPTDVEIRKRQRSRAVVMGLLLAVLAVLLYGITIARIGLQ